MDNQISMFDILAELPPVPKEAPALDLTTPRRYLFQASFAENGRSFHVLGSTRAVTTPEAVTRDPSPLLALNLTGYYLRNEIIPRAQQIDVFFSEVDEADRPIRQKADAHIIIPAAALYALLEHAA